jgi:F-type H+-transporting ATPase subunit c
MWMRRKLAWLGLAVVVLLVVLSSVALAAEAAKKSDAELRYFGIVAASATFGLAIAAIGGAFSQSRGIRSALEGIARNPGASGPITTTMIIGLALIESLVIYVLVVCLILLIVNPFGI